MSPLLLAAVITVHGVTLQGDNGMKGQLCVIGPDLAYTAAHVFRPPEGPEATTGTFIETFEQGRVELVSMDRTRDFAIVRVAAGSPKFSSWHVIGKEPEVGDRLYWRGNNWYAKDWYVDDGPYFGLDEEGDLIAGEGNHPGMSGGCICNAQGEAVGVLLGRAMLTYIGNGVPPTTYGYPLWKQKKKEVK